MDYNIYTSSYLGLIAKESPDEIIVKVINNKRVSVNKFRQIAMIAGANPETFFEIKNGKAEPIMDKETIYNNLHGQYTFKDTFTNLWPAWFRGLVGSSEKHRGGKPTSIMIDNELIDINDPRVKQSHKKQDDISDKTAKNLNILRSRANNRHIKGGAAAADETKALLNKAIQNVKKSEKKMLNAKLRGTFNAAQEQLLKDKRILEDAQKQLLKDERILEATDAKSAFNKDAKYNRNIGVAAAFVILCFILKHRRNKSNRIVKLLETPSSFIRDSIEESGLSNNGYYNGALADTNSNLHHLFKVSDKKNETVDELRYRLFTKWKSSYWASNQLQSSHLIRSNGSIRDTVEEIGNAIQLLQDFNPLRIPSMALSKVYTSLSRRKSSQEYLRSRTSRKSRSRSRTKKSKKYNR